MIDSVVEFLTKGLVKEVKAPVFGSQHKGVAPGGAMDFFSHQIGIRLLNQYPDSTSLELIIAPQLRFKQECWFVLTGAKYDNVTIGQQSRMSDLRDVSPAKVCLAKAGDVLSFGRKILGFRTYLSWLPVKESAVNLEGRCRADYETVYNWVDENGVIRLLEGPEFRYLTDKNLFTGTYWTITNDFSDMGFRLSTRGALPGTTLTSMISEPVADGTIQLAPQGPIILLKQRQTVGGYPRIYNVISADVDLLAQYAPGQILRFKTLSIREAHTIAQAKQAALTHAIVS